MWDGHDAFVSEQFRCEPKLLAHHVKKMMKNGQIDRARQLLVTFGEEPRPDLSEVTSSVSSDALATGCPALT